LTAETLLESRQPDEAAGFCRIFARLATSRTATFALGVLVCSALHWSKEFAARRAEFLEWQRVIRDRAGQDYHEFGVRRR
jgi:hypothetical protein